MIVAEATQVSQLPKLSDQESTKMPQGAIYSGKGAIFFGDLAFILELLDISYEALDEGEIQKGELNKFKLLMVPGGYTQEYMPALGEIGKEAIRNFVREGGAYIGICAGAYIAARKVEVPGKPGGLGLIEVQNIRKAGVGMRKIYLEKHPITEGLGEELEIYYHNGPEIVAGSGVSGVAYYQNGRLAIVSSFFGKGKVVIFSPHPEGCISQGIKPKPKALKLLQNCLKFCQY